MVDDVDNRDLVATSFEIVELTPADMRALRSFCMEGKRRSSMIFGV